MAAHQTYEEQKKFVFNGLMLLALITIGEVFLALLLRGHITSYKYTEGSFVHYVYMALMVGISLYKAYFIIFHFMHMAHEVKGLVYTVLLPTTLLVWAIIAFFNEGGAWRQSRERIKNSDREGLQAPTSVPAQGSIYIPSSDDFKLV